MSLFDLSGRVALVTGGNGGIGLGMALGLANAGARIAVVGRNAEKSESAVGRIKREAGIDAFAITADVTKPDDVTRALAETADRFGRLDILLNNAGVTVRKKPQDLLLEEWNFVLDGNLTSVFTMSKAAYPIMKSAGGGKVINIGSMTSIFGSSYAVPYAASKGAVVQLTKSLALAWAEDNIQVNAILPGWFDTELTRGARAHVPGLHERVIERTPARRWGMPEDIAGAAVFLASRASDFVTGAALAVDGGYSSAP